MFQSNQVPSSPATLRNREPIFSVLKEYLKDGHRVFEIGSGTGQHSNYFAEQLPNIQWQPSDLVENHEVISYWTRENTNVSSPVAFDVFLEVPQFDFKFDIIFTANTLHIMPWAGCAEAFSKASTLAAEAAQFFVYGPFNYDGQYTSPSNEAFDEHLRLTDSQMGIRDIEKVVETAEIKGWYLKRDWEMPANNRLLVFAR